MSRDNNVVIIGGGIAGVTLAEELRRRKHSGPITIIETEKLLYDRPPLSKEYLLGHVPETQLALRPKEWFATNQIRLLTQTHVTKLEKNHVKLANGTHLACDIIVLATGGRARPLHNLDTQSPLLHFLRTLEDARRLQPHLGKDRHILIIGAGLIGAEVASTASATGTHITLVDPTLPLENLLGATISTWLHKQHAQAGAHLIRGRVTRLTTSDTHVTADVRANDNSTYSITADIAITCTGLTPETTLAEEAGIATNNGIIVTPNQRTSWPNIWAIGDCTRPSASNGTLLHPNEHWESAIHDATRAAADITGTPPPQEQTPWFWTDRYGYHIELTGDLHPHNPSTAHITRGTFGEPPFTVFATTNGILTGALSVNDPRTNRTARRLIDRQTHIAPEKLTDIHHDLRQYARR
ncbi:NAD(P)/FAD-dependent oxidoreductase [Dermatophilus congolensis]|uniref:NAD(P)/FAD-dependent oxidoreductase n=1 Tax=Dermatophilus congolensis TaxID=1863 RepID=UPI001AAFF85C|nr:FAD-dependent oxidoreductase [Dermatophilus congolensis]MBO3130505.1 FAD-dependent oxidoreductase [Dermatophilus congolensis]MBO3130865.1 FAD-dependent oxidoreductase [Dermatophilus congolensis]MBO3134977.1 FAD-dependent oxidoreductase [Dermatophilus congolensis]MBO3137216.1 FAD-dependent oxidoreductase [Dermatophilus congolensis]MBO3139459.1 FAD-dependent oxidoreductase [Dermatophilus congolensis]